MIRGREQMRITGKKRKKGGQYNDEAWKNEWQDNKWHNQCLEQ